MRVVAPFSLLVPVFGMASSALLLGETLGTLRLAGAALVICGLAGPLPEEESRLGSCHGAPR